MNDTTVYESICHQVSISGRCGPECKLYQTPECAPYVERQKSERVEALQCARIISEGNCGPDCKLFDEHDCPAPDENEPDTRRDLPSPTIGLTPWGAFVIKFGAMVGTDDWKAIRQQAERYLDTGQDWQVYLSELAQGASELAERLPEIMSYEEERNDKTRYHVYRRLHEHA